MPNWCANNIELRHKDPAMITRAVEAFKQGKFLNEFVPVPEELQIVAGRLGSDDNPEQIALAEAEQRNRDKYGYTTWYDFCIDNWGTKWDVGDEDSINTTDDGLMVAFFDSAWSPPVRVYEHLVELGFEVTAQYYEPGMCFVGEWINGNDACYEIPGTSDEVAESIPAHLDEMFAISEWMSENEPYDEDDGPLSEEQLKQIKEANE